MFHNIARYVFFYVGDTYSVLRSLIPWAQGAGRSRALAGRSRAERAGLDEAELKGHLPAAARAPSA